MLNKEQIEEIRNAVARVDLEKAIRNAKDMGIEVTKKKLGYHGMYNEDGVLEKLDIDRHFRINDTIEIVETNKNETFSYTFKTESSSKTSSIEIDELLVV